MDRSGNTLWAGGYSRGTLTGPRASLAVPARWNVTTHTLSWGAVGTSANPSVLNDVFLAMSAVSPNVFVGVGYETNVSNVDQTFATMECEVHFQMTAPITAVTGSGFSLSVSVWNGLGFPATYYVGTVHFTSSDKQATLPADYTFVSGDAGTHTFTGVVLRSPYHETVTATDTVIPFIAASTTVSVHCPGVCQSTVAPPPARSPASSSGSGVHPPPRIPARAPAASTAARSREAYPRLL
jgi:hypothetical protein